MQFGDHRIKPNAVVRRVGPNLHSGDVLKHVDVKWVFHHQVAKVPATVVPLSKGPVNTLIFVGGVIVEVLVYLLIVGMFIKTVPRHK